jgi:hypothetical protein
MRTCLSVWKFHSITSFQTVLRWCHGLVICSENGLMINNKTPLYYDRLLNLTIVAYFDVDEQSRSRWTKIKINDREKKPEIILLS